MKEWRGASEGAKRDASGMGLMKAEVWDQSKLDTAMNTAIKHLCNATGTSEIYTTVMSTRGP